MATVTIRYWAAAGTHEEPGDGRTLAAVLERATAGRGPEFARVLAHSSFLIDGVRARPDTPLTDGAVIEVLPPFAGG